MPRAGEKKITSFNITNADLGAIGFFGGAASSSVKAALKSLTNRKIRLHVAKVIGSRVIPGISFASWAALAVGVINGKFGNKGFKVTLTLQYKEFFFHQQGHYVRGWDIVNLKVRTY